MSDTLKTSGIPLMTEDRLRAHWFGGPCVPFWEYDPARITVGVEVEYFIGKNTKEGLVLANKSQFLAVIEELVAKAGYNHKNLADQPGRVSKDTDIGFIAIKPDFAWHILEVAFPPRLGTDGLSELIETTLSDIDRALIKIGLCRINLSCLPSVPTQMDLLHLDRLVGHTPSSESLKDYSSDKVIFPALIAATHIHINCSDERSLAKMPSLYSQEEEAMSRFVKAKNFKGKSYDNVRSMHYEKVLGDGYMLRTIPPRIPSSIADYVELFNESTPLFPNDLFFPVRDLSYIRPTRFGTLEFRSACSFLEVEKIVEIAEFRVQQVLKAHGLSSAVKKRSNNL